MSEFKHTPGPWRISRTSGMEIFINQDYDQPNRVPGYFAEVRRFTSDHEQVDANARLIAAAPELLEALEQLVSDYERGIHVEFGGSPWLKEKLEELDYARAAIAKALGE